MYHELEEELVNSLEMGPRWIHFFLLVDTGLSHTKIRFFDVGKWSENILLNHLHYFVQIRYDQTRYVLLVL